MKRFILTFLITFLSFCLVTSNVEAKSFSTLSSVLIMDQYTTEYDKFDEFDTNCQDFANVLRIGGYAIMLVKILIPIILIFKASVNLVSVVTQGKQEELKKQANKLLMSLIAGIIVFFIPTVINVIFGFVEDYNDNITEDSEVCRACIFDPFGELCNSHITE